MEISQILQTNQRLYRVTEGKNDRNSIELPEQIDVLIDNKMYRNKFKKLIREGHLTDLLQLAEMAHSKTTPSRWFAVVTSKARWEGTLKWLAKLQQVARNAAEVAKRLNVAPGDMKAVYKACWKLGDQVIRHAITAAETGKNSYRYFNWLCLNT